MAQAEPKTTRKPRMTAEEKAEQAATKAGQDQANAQLKDIAEEVKVRLGKSDDYRLSAAIKIAEAKAICDANNIKWKPWAEKNIKTLGWESVRKLVPVGAAETKKEGSGAKLLTKMRAGNAKNQRKRDAGRVTGKGKGNTDTSAPKITSSVSPEMVALDLLTETLEDTKAAHVITEAAGKLGLVVSPKAAVEADAPAPVAGVKDVIAMFSDLKPSDKMQALQVAAKIVGVEISWPEGMAPEPVSDDLLDIPAFLKRKPKAKRRTRRTA